MNAMSAFNYLGMRGYRTGGTRFYIHAAGYKIKRERRDWDAYGVLGAQGGTSAGPKEWWTVYEHSAHGRQLEDFDTLRAAKAWCDARELVHTARMSSTGVTMENDVRSLLQDATITSVTEVRGRGEDRLILGLASGDWVVIRAERLRLHSHTAQEVAADNAARAREDEGERPQRPVP